MRIFALIDSIFGIGQVQLETAVFYGDSFAPRSDRYFYISGLFTPSVL